MLLVNTTIRLHAAAAADADFITRSAASATRPLLAAPSDWQCRSWPGLLHLHYDEVLNQLAASLSDRQLRHTMFCIAARSNGDWDLGRQRRSTDCLLSVDRKLQK